MDGFTKLNPKTTFLFFVFIIVLTLVLFHPVYLALSLVSSLTYKIKLKGKAALKSFFKFNIPLIVFVAVFNMLFTHYGETLFFTVSDMRFTFESLFYGFCQGMLFSSVMMWFDCYCTVITSERFLAVFGKIAPNLALLFSMVLTFIPRLKRNAAQINDARQLIKNSGNRLKKSADNFSALITMTLEESIEVSDSMRARGFTQDRSVYSKYRFALKDIIIMAVSVLLTVFIIIMKASGKIDFVFEPEIYMKGLSFIAVLAYAAISFFPLLIDLTEDIRWLYLKQKI